MSERPRADGGVWGSYVEYLTELEQERDSLREQLAESEAYAKEGWAWNDDMIDALGIKTVFEIPQAKARIKQMEEALREAWRLADGLGQRALAQRIDEMRDEIDHGTFRVALNPNTESEET